MQVYASLSHRARLDVKDPQSVSSTRLQTILNDVARVLLGKRRTDHITVRDLMDKSSLKSLNHIVIEQSGLLAWKMSRPGHPLHRQYQEATMDARTRSAGNNILRVPPLSGGNLAIYNAFTVWNASTNLRSATSEEMAKRAIKKFARSAPV